VALALEKKRAVEPGKRSERLFDVGPEHSLEELLAAVSSSLEIRGQARCPVCQGTLEPAPDGGAAACASCGSRLT
jgi:DnaJ-class molecular chaperone